MTGPRGDDESQGSNGAKLDANRINYIGRSTPILQTLMRCGPGVLSPG